MLFEVVKQILSIPVMRDLHPLVMCPTAINCFKQMIIKSCFLFFYPVHRIRFWSFSSRGRRHAIGGNVLKTR